MANIKSQIKRNRTNEQRRQRNKSVRSELKTHAKKALAAAESGDADAAHQALRTAQSTTDAAVSKGVLHKSTAARRKSRLAAQVERLLAG
jgi:small subunit ribosomal protein S20